MLANEGGAADDSDGCEDDLEMHIIITYNYEHHSKDVADPAGGDAGDGNGNADERE